MNGLNSGLAFVEGLALIASPCILPVLPLVLATSIEGGRRRPYGIILGFVAAFSAFAFTARWLVGLLSLDLDYIKIGSLVLLGVFGAVLLSARLSARFAALTRSAADLGSRLGPSRGAGFAGGVMIGALIGLVWTPCAGPILATALVQIIRQQSGLQAGLVIVSFALGAGAPMLVIALAGRRLLDKLRFFARHAEGLRRAFGVVILASVALLASGVGAQARPAPTDTPAPPATVATVAPLERGLAHPYPAPPLRGVEQWLNSPPLTIAGLRGKVVLVDFWTYSCINCVRTLPHVTRWDRTYRDQGLVIIGVHSPEFEFEKKLANVRAAIAKHGIQYPVALDNRLETFASFENRYWPAHYLIDREGRVVYVHFGEGSYDVTERNLRKLLGARGPTSPTAGMTAAELTATTPETYLGYARAERLRSREPVRRDRLGAYAFPPSLGPDEWALTGTWRVRADRIVAGEKGATIRLRFTARRVFLVLGAADGRSRHATVRLNHAAVGVHAGKDAPGGEVNVTTPTLYELIDQPGPKEGVLEIRAEEPGLEAYAFTFG